MKLRKILFIWVKNLFLDKLVKIAKELFSLPFFRLLATSVFVCSIGLSQRFIMSVFWKQKGV